MSADYPFMHFGLIVTGKGEQKFLPQLFRSIAATNTCTFEVIRKIGQRKQITSTKTIAKMVGKQRTVPKIDEVEIGIVALKFLRADQRNVVIVIDDLEFDNLPHAKEKFDRYRRALDTILNYLPDFKTRASVHFLVNMLEAYYFADAQAINRVFPFDPPLGDFLGDVEAIRHPKRELKQLCEDRLGISFDEVEDGEKILSLLQVDHVLSNPQTCVWLRVLFAWCIEQIIECYYGFPLTPEWLGFLCEDEHFATLIDRCYLKNGRLSDISRIQLRLFGVHFTELLRES